MKLQRWEKIIFKKVKKIFTQYASQVYSSSHSIKKKLKLEITKNVLRILFVQKILPQTPIGRPTLTEKALALHEKIWEMNMHSH